VVTAALTASAAVSPRTRRQMPLHYWWGGGVDGGDGGARGVGRPFAAKTAATASALAAVTWQRRQ